MTKYDKIREVLQKYGEDVKQKYVYHYTSGSGLQSIIENNELWLTERNYMNDKLEIKYTQEIIKDVLQTNYNFSISLIEKIFFEKEQSFIFSTSLAKDSINMWSYYSGEDAYCIEFDRRLLRDYFRDTLTNKGELLYGPVIYSKTKQKKIISDVCSEVIIDMAELIKSSSDKKEDRIDDYLNTKYVYQFFYSICKQQGHSCERELRYVVNKTNRTKFLVKKGLFIPITIIGSKKDMKIPINRIIIGPNNHEEIAQDSLKMFLNQNEYTKVDIIHSSLETR